MPLQRTPHAGPGAAARVVIELCEAAEVIIPATVTAAVSAWRAVSHAEPRPAGPLADEAVAAAVDALVQRARRVRDDRRAVVLSIDHDRIEQASREEDRANTARLIWTRALNTTFNDVVTAIDACEDQIVSAAKARHAVIAPEFHRLAVSLPPDLTAAAVVHAKDELREPYVAASALWDQWQALRTLIGDAFVPDAANWPEPWPDMQLLALVRVPVLDTHPDRQTLRRGEGITFDHARWLMTQVEPGDCWLPTRAEQADRARQVWPPPAGAWNVKLPPNAVIVSG